MPKRCGVSSCRCAQDCEVQQVSLHRVPQDEGELERWNAVTGEQLRRTQYICSRHFQDSDYQGQCGGVNKRLKLGCIPSLHLDSKECEKLACQNEFRRLKKQLTAAKARISALEHENKDLRKSIAQLNSYRELFQRDSNEYTSRQKKVATTLHLCSSKAYSYLRQQLNLPLPAPRTIRRWLENIDATPGLSNSALKLVSEKLDIYKDVCLIIDSMHIKKHISMDTRTNIVFGFVDIGDGASTSEATEVLVFMVVSLKLHGRLPIAYYLTNGLQSDDLAHLVTTAIGSLHCIGCNVRVVTMDGASNNIGMANALGCRLTGSGDICTFFMVPDGEARWSLIAELHQIQHQLGLHLGNRLTNRHIDFDNNKMKVNLAVQVLSRSVAVSLEFLEQQGMMENTAATSKLIKELDIMFDIMNSRSPHAAGYKAPLRASNLEERKEKLLEVAAYISEVRESTNVKVLHTCRKTGIMGLRVDAQTLCSLAIELLQEQPYLLTYKLSQDNLELFFNSVRQAGGWSNNPTAQQFRNIFKSLITTRFDELPRNNDGNCHSEPTEREVTLSVSQLLREHQYNNVLTVSQLPELWEPVIGNIAGFIADRITATNNCHSCNSFLVEQPTDRSHHGLIKKRDLGGLTYPSSGLTQLLGHAETVFRSYMSCHQMNNRFSALFLKIAVMDKVDTCRLLQMSQHAIDTQVGVSNHHEALVGRVLTAFYKVRCLQISKLHNIDLHDQSIRQRNNRNTILSGQ